MSKKQTKSKTQDASPSDVGPDEAATAAQHAEVIPDTASREETATEDTAGQEALRDQLLRLRADFDNFRKRTRRERDELFLYANESFFTELLPVLDHFELGLKSAEEHQTDPSVTEGFRIVYRQLLDTLKKFKVEPIDATGEVFDPHAHEAITHLPSDQPAETVIEQVRRGYRLGERLLRAAQVVVSSGPASTGDSTE